MKTVERLHLAADSVFWLVRHLLSVADSVFALYLLLYRVLCLLPRFPWHFFFFGVSDDAEMDDSDVDKIDGEGWDKGSAEDGHDNHDTDEHDDESDELGHDSGGQGSKSGLPASRLEGVSGRNGATNSGSLHSSGNNKRRFITSFRMKH